MDDQEVEIEYVNEPIDGGELAAAFADVFKKFNRTDETSNQEDQDDEQKQQQLDKTQGDDKPTGSSDIQTVPDKENPPNVSKRRLKEQTRMTVAQLKQLVSRPELVELHDVTAREPVYLLHMKSAKNSVPVPRHWCSKRRYLQGKRGYEKSPFQLPDFIRQTGIMEMRDSNQEKDSQKSLKAKTRERVQPKMGKIQVDYQQLHDAFFKWQTKPRLTIHGDLYYEGKEFEKKFKKKPGELSNELRRALGMPIGPNAYRYPPPWLTAMKRHGPPPSYPYLKIPGLNCPFPDEDDDKLSQTSETFNDDRIPSRRGTKIATLPGSNCNLGQFCDHIIAIEGIRQQDFLVGRKTKLFRPDNCSLRSISLPNNALVDIIIPLVAGKGGFGSLLRAIGAQIEKTTNRDACRDLSGRRLSNIKREEDLKKLIALQERLKEEKARRKKEKLEKLKKKVETSKTSASIQELVNMFDDHQYNRRRLEIGDIIEAAIDKGIINAKKRKADVDDLVELDATKKHKTDPIDEQSRDASPELREPNDSHDGSRVDKSTAGSEDRAPVKSEPVNARPQINATGPWLGASSDEDDNT